MNYNTEENDNILAEGHYTQDDVTLNYYMYSIGEDISDYKEGDLIEETLFVGTEL